MSRFAPVLLVFHIPTPVYNINNEEQSCRFNGCIARYLSAANGLNRCRETSRFPLSTAPDKCKRVWCLLSKNRQCWRI